MAVELNEIEEAEVELEEWLVEQAENGVPEIVLIGLLRDYADDIEQKRTQNLRVRQTSRRDTRPR